MQLPRRHATVRRTRSRAIHASSRGSLRKRGATAVAPLFMPLSWLREGPADRLVLFDLDDTLVEPLRCHHGTNSRHRVVEPPRWASARPPREPCNLPFGGHEDHLAER